MEELIETGAADVVGVVEVVEDGVVTLEVVGGFEVILEELPPPLLLLREVVEDDPVPNDTFCRRTKLMPSTVVVVVDADVPKATRPRRTKVYR